jgi:hypothetical protein
MRCVAVVYYRKYSKMDVNKIVCKKVKGKAIPVPGHGGP